MLDFILFLGVIFSKLILLVTLSSQLEPINNKQFRMALQGKNGSSESTHSRRIGFNNLHYSSFKMIQLFPIINLKEPKNGNKTSLGLIRVKFRTLIPH